MQLAQDAPGDVTQGEVLLRALRPEHRQRLGRAAVVQRHGGAVGAVDVDLRLERGQEPVVGEPAPVRHDGVTDRLSGQQSRRPRGDDPRVALDVTAGASPAHRAGGDGRPYAQAVLQRGGWRPAVWLAVCVVAVGGCGAARPGATAADATVETFYRAVSADDGTGACAVLAPATVETLEDDADEPCAEAVLDGEVGETLAERAEDPRDPSARVAGRAAQVTVATDVVFLTISGDHWLVTAAGCDARPDRPYDCVLEGS